MDDNSALGSTMSSSFTNMDDMATPASGGMSAPKGASGLGSMKTKLKNALTSDDSKDSSGKGGGAPAAAPSIYGGIQSTMMSKLNGDS